MKTCLWCPWPVFWCPLRISTMKSVLYLHTYVTKRQVPAYLMASTDLFHDSTKGHDLQLCCSRQFANRYQKGTTGEEWLKYRRKLFAVCTCLTGVYGDFQGKTRTLLCRLNPSFSGIIAVLSVTCTRDNSQPFSVSAFALFPHMYLYWETSKKACSFLNFRLLP